MNGIVLEKFCLVEEEMATRSQRNEPESAPLLEDIELAPVPPSIASIANTLNPIPQAETTIFKDLRFGSVTVFTPWFPKVNPKHLKAQTWKIWWSNRRTALGAQVATSVLVLIANLILTILPISKGSTTNGIGTIYEGDCGSIRKWNTVLHLGINILSTILLSASNFCMQLLVAPIRSEIDRAHGEQAWMDIGIPSLRNLGYINWKRKVVWVLLALSSGTLHLLRNSAVFASFPFVTYSVAVVTSDYYTNEVPWNASAKIRTLQTGKGFEHLNQAQCIELYGNPTSGAGDIIVVTSSRNNSITYNDGSSLLLEFSLALRDDWSTLDLWLCAGTHSGCTSRNLAIELAEDPWMFRSANGILNVPIEYCLSSGILNIDTKCNIQYSAAIMIIVCIMNAMKCLCICYTFILFSGETPSFVTIGDAIQSFLTYEDSNTTQMCLGSQNDFASKTWVQRERYWERPKPIRRFSLAGQKQWITTIILSAALLLIALGLLVQALVGMKQESEAISIGRLWSYGLGEVHPTLLVGIFKAYSKSQFWLVVGFANSWQLEVSCLYLLYNALISTLCASEEWSHFGIERKFLRVSAPRGMQRSTYFLSLPFRYGIPLTVGMSFCHWCISQAVFLAQASAYFPNGTRNFEADDSRVGYSPIGIVFSIVVGVVFIISLIGLGFGKITFHLPVVSTNSAAISAAAHKAPGDGDAALLPVQWGVVDPAKLGKPGHCCLTTACDVEEPEDGEMYL